MSIFKSMARAVPFGKSMGELSLKALTGRVKFPGRALVFFDLDSPEVSQIAAEVGDGTSSDVLMTPIRWLSRAIVEAPVVAKDAAGEPIELSDLVSLLATPNPHYAWEVLIAGTVMSLSLDGNAYWIAALNADGLPVELWYAPHTNVEPKWPADDPMKFVTYYQYKVQADEQRIALLGADPADVDPRAVEGLAMIQFREGVDPDNLRKGLSPLKGLLREVWTDNEAARFTASLLRNNGIPGVVVSPKNEEGAMTPEEGEVAKEKLLTEYTGAGRGRPLVMLGPTDVQQFGFSPKELDLSPLRDISEERVTAALGVQAAVVGFGSGLQQTKVGATMESLIRLSWSSGVIPIQRIVGGEVTRSLGPLFDVASAEFDNGGVQALRENQDTKARRIQDLVRAAVLTRAEGRVELGFEAFPGDEVYLMSLATVEVPQGQLRPAPTNGNDPERRADIDAAIKQVIGVAGAVPDYWVTLDGIFIKRHTHDPTEEAIIGAAPSRRATSAAARMARRLDGIRVRAGAVMQEPLERVFDDLGQVAFEAARDILDGLELVSDGGGEAKQDELPPEDISLAEEIFEEVRQRGLETAKRKLQEVFELGYLQAQDMTAAAVAEVLGQFELGDVVQQNVLRRGGLRAGLIDLDGQTRDAIFRSLAEGRAQGLTADNLARFIRDGVEAGPWSDAATRARVIARTEGANAANSATLETARGMPDTENVQVFDDRTGFGDAACVEANGSVITIQEAEAIGLAHPNCTRAFVPINALLMEEMGL